MSGNTKPIFVTGGCGFIGSNFILDWLKLNLGPVVNLDLLTYAGSEQNLANINGHKNYRFIQGDINNTDLVNRLFADYQPRAMIHFAAQSHVDNSISAPDEFICTNINGTFNLLSCARAYWSRTQNPFRFIHISTDEVYGSLDCNDPPFTETHPYQPNSPYSASKAASDHLVRAWFHTYGLPVITTNCSNNYGPHQFAEKLIPLMITQALANKPLPIYGNGKHIRDWLYVSDHCAAIRCVLEHGQLGESYNIGGNCEKSNIDLVTELCDLLDQRAPRPKSYRELITYVEDRPGHDYRYAIDSSKIQRELGWTPQERFKSGLDKTLDFYLKTGVNI